MSLLPTIFVSVTELQTCWVSSSAAPSRPGERLISSEKVKSFSAMWVSRMACCCSCRFSTHSAFSASTSVQKLSGAFWYPVICVTSLQCVKTFRGFSIRVSRNSGSVSAVRYRQPGRLRLSLSTVKGMANSNVRMPPSPSGVYSTVTRTVPESSAFPSRSSRLWR